ncbi:uncharacterized protein LOC117329034 [Pecten maximus]|uniref:uncharacterized protein LOC117329034 n=1 Tax=Pecten maximus TaxID=6579 RepID=UPI001458F869|nr:uncharacterized protein LOC117329034 [Pecten maximus]
MISDSDINDPECDTNGREDSINIPECDTNYLEGDINSSEGDINSSEGDINSSEGDINSPECDTNSSEGDINSPECDINSSEGDINSPECDSKSSEGDMDSQECETNISEGDMDCPECASDCPGDVYIVKPVVETDATSERHRKRRFNAELINNILMKVSVFLLFSQPFKSQFMTNISSGKLSTPMMEQKNILFPMNITSSSYAWNHRYMYVYAVPFPFVRLRCGQGQVGSNSSYPSQSSSVLDGHHPATGVQPPSTIRQMSVRRGQPPERRQPFEERQISPLVGRQRVAQAPDIVIPQGIYPHTMPYHIEVINRRQVIRVDFDPDFIANSHHYGAISVTSDMSVVRRQSSVRMQQLHLRDGMRSWNGQQTNMRGQLQPSSTGQQNSSLRERLSVVRQPQFSFTEQPSDRRGHDLTEREISSLGIYSHIMHYRVEVINGRQVIRVDFDPDFIANSHRYGAISVTSDMSVVRRQSSVRRQPSRLREEPTRWHETQSSGHTSRRQPAYLTDETRHCREQQSNMRRQLQPSAAEVQPFIEGLPPLRDRLSDRRRVRSSHREEYPDTTGQESTERTIDSERIYPHTLYYHIEEIDGIRVIRVVYTTDFLNTFHLYDIIYVSQSPP